MEPLQHDPRTKLQIKEAIYTHLYAPIEREFQARLDTLILRNTLLGGYNHKSFVYKGQTYNIDITPMPSKRNRLVPQLKSVMDEYLADLKTVNEEEMPFILGFVNQVLNASNSFQDYLKLLPEAVHPPIQALHATCPCQFRQLPDDKVADLRIKNRKSIDLMKQRMVKNLLI